MALLADRIEKLILNKLFEEENLILKRNELANQLECAPSQISYVINTRFSNNNRFNVESRRGLGGFIRITRVDPNDGKEQTALVPIDTKGNLIRIEQKEKTKPKIAEFKEGVPRNIQEVDRWIGVLLYKQMINEREALILHEAFLGIFEEVPKAVLANVVNSYFERLMRKLRGE